MRWAAWVVAAIGGGVVGWLLLRYLLPLLAPFLLAWGIALMLAPLAARMHTYTRLPRRLCSVILLLLTLLLIALLLTLAVNRLVGEIQRLLDWMGDDGGARIAAWVGRVRDWLVALGDRLPLADELLGGGTDGLLSGVDEIAADMITETLTGISAAIPTRIAAVLRALPGIMLFLAVTVLACFYFSLDLDRIHALLRHMLPRAFCRRLPALRRRVTGTALRWLRAYFLLLILTFFELLVGFSLLDLDYAFLPALSIAALDLLPVFGVGTVLLPWAGGCFLGGNYRLGLGLLILYGVVTVIRQIAEPRIVGESIGLHPLITLAAMYVGFRVWGLGGMLLSPAVALVLGSASGDADK